MPPPQAGMHPALTCFAPQTKIPLLFRSIPGAHMRKLYFFCLIVFVISIFVQAAESNSPLLLRFPTISKTQIVFNYGGALLIASRGRREARRLPSGVRTDALPYFPPR